MVGHLLKVGTHHWIPHWKCTVNCPSISFGWPNPEIGRKMADGRLLFKFCVHITNNYISYLHLLALSGSSLNAAEIQDSLT